MPLSPRAPRAGSGVYETGWLAINRFLQLGQSWSGQERNCAFLNTHGERFANVSAASGLDFPDDGRALAVVDWDGDGDLDIWLASRTGPRLRLMRNESNPAVTGNQFVSFSLRGTTCNRDAIGARVEVHLKQQSKLIQTLHAGDAFLSQSSKSIHFGLGKDPEIERVVVRWPGGKPEDFGSVSAGRRYVLTQGRGQAETLVAAARPLKLAPSKQTPPAASDVARVVLSDRYPMPGLTYTNFSGVKASTLDLTGKPLLINLWASWCQPCVEELKELAAAQARLSASGVEVLALSVDGLGQDKPTRPADAKRMADRLKLPFLSGTASLELLEKLEILQDRLFDLRVSFAVPSSFLIDREGNLAVIYRGPLTVDRLVQDLSLLEASPAALRDLSVPFAGRWFSRPGRIYLERIAEDFAERYPEEAIRYLQIAVRDAVAAGQTVGPAGRKQNAKDQVKTRLSLASLLARQARYPEAQTEAGQALALEPENVEANLLRAELYYRENKPAEAIGQYRKVLELDPKRGGVRYNLASLLYQSGQRDLAIEQLHETLRLNPEMVHAHFDLGFLLNEAGRHAEAIESFRKVLAATPDHMEANLKLGVSLERLERFDEAAAQFRRTIALNTNYTDAYFELGTLLRKRGDTAQAVAQFRQVLRLKPNDQPGHLGLGMAHYKAGQAEEALQQLREAVRLKPDEPAAADRLAWVLSTSEDAKLRSGEEAVRWAKRACDATRNENARFLATLAAAYAEAGRFEEAVAATQQALQLAKAGPDEKAAQLLESRLAAYRQRHPLRAPAAEIELD